MSKRIFMTATMLACSTATQAGEMDGKAVYDSSCAACHASGVAGAPKLGDNAVWAERIAKGMAALEESAINGLQGYSGTMPPKGGNASLSDDEVKAAVAYMVEQSQ